MGLVGTRVLITGIAGFVGANLTARLLGDGADVHGLVREGTDLWRLGDVLPRMTVHHGDLTAPHTLDRAVAAARPHVVYHLAVERASASHADRAYTLATNVAGTLNLLEAVAANEGARIVHVGSSLEYGPQDHATHESDLLAPRSFFGATKAAATLVARQFAHEHGLPLVCLRPYSVYGYWEDPGRLVPTVIRAAMGAGEIALTAPGYRRDLIFVEDVIDGCLAAAATEQAVGEIVNIGSGVQWTNEQVVDAVESIAGRKLLRHVGAYPAHQTDTACWVADNRKARQMLRWEPAHSLLRGLEKTWAWMERHRAEYDRIAGTAPNRGGHGA